jgi:hypothetical protein
VSNQLHRRYAAAVLLWALPAGLSIAAEPAGHAESEAVRVADLIDAALQRQWEADHIVPAPLSDDGEFLRRVSLDLHGRIPGVMPAREFRADPSPDKRRRVIDELIADPRCAVHFTNVWRSVLIPEAETDLNYRYLIPSFDAWLRTRLLENASYRDMVREILDADVSGSNPYQYNAATPIAFYTTKEIKPENLAAATSRMFLGVRLECAQCHNHPFDRWTRQDFWGYAAFFASLERQQPGPGSVLATIREFLGQRNVRIPDTDEYVEPTFLGGEKLARGLAVRPRQAVSDWITGDDNPYFARMAVNRLWAHFFGVGIVDPVDDFTDQTRPSHPDLLDALAEEFRTHNYDLHFLMRSITYSQAYQLSSRQTDPSQTYPQRFAKMALKGLTAEQVYDSLAQATGRFEPFSVQSPFVFNPQSPRSRFDDLFADESGAAIDRPTTILQSLALMNGEFIAQATHVDESQTLAGILDFPGFDTGDRVDAVFLAALTRPPADEERRKFVAYVESGGPRNDPRLALSDVFWVLLNSTEFLYNH